MFVPESLPECVPESLPMMSGCNQAARGYSRGLGLESDTTKQTPLFGVASA